MLSKFKKALEDILLLGVLLVAAFGVFITSFWTFETTIILGVFLLLVLYL